MNHRTRVVVLFCLAAVFSFHGTAQHRHSVSVNAAVPKGEVQPTMWGVFFEDINFGADGGIYAELIKNRSFEFPDPLMGWKKITAGDARATVLIVNRGEGETNHRFAHIKTASATGSFGMKNEGFRGIGVKNGSAYNFSMLVRGSGSVRLRAELVDTAGRSLGQCAIGAVPGAWTRVEASLQSNATEANARFILWVDGTGELDVDMISLFPRDTWKQRPGGLRADAIQLLADMKPGFIRFPGGCIVEGRDLANRYQWKKTIGPVDKRELMVNRWNMEFAHKLTPDYYQTFGLGFYEYFLLAEDIGAEPLPIINCGMACQYNTAELVSNDHMDPYIQDMLDLVEFANGDSTTTWGRMRIGLGHPSPFNLKMMGVGNEQWGEQYIEKHKLVSRILKEKYPSIKLISSAGPDPDGEKFTYLTTELRKLNTDFIDEHYYRAPSWFLKYADRYDAYDRSGPRIFAGEYAAHSGTTTTPKNQNNWECAMAEAAFMTGLERNADLVNMASYAPLFANINAWQWAPDLIWMDNLRVLPTPNYYVQKLFATNRGTHTLSIAENGSPLSGRDSLYASAVLDRGANTVTVKIVNAGTASAAFDISLEGIRSMGMAAAITVMKAKLSDVNTFDAPTMVVPETLSQKISGKRISLTIEPSSFVVITVPNVRL